MAALMEWEEGGRRAEVLWQRLAAIPLQGSAQRDTPLTPSTGEAVARKRRVPTCKGFDFFVEGSAVEVYNEGIHDLLQTGSAAGCNLQVCAGGGGGHAKRWQRQ